MNFKANNHNHQTIMRLDENNKTYMHGNYQKIIINNKIHIHLHGKI
jgi:hypothetical protein